MDDNNLAPRIGVAPNGRAIAVVDDVPPRIIASPLARRIARESGVDLVGVLGTGPGGRIVRRDVDAVAEALRSSGFVIRLSVLADIITVRNAVAATIPHDARAWQDLAVVESTPTSWCPVDQFPVPRGYRLPEPTRPILYVASRGARVTLALLAAPCLLGRAEARAWLEEVRTSIESAP